MLHSRKCQNVEVSYLPRVRVQGMLRICRFLAFHLVQWYVTDSESDQNNAWGLQIISIILITWPQLKWILSNHSFWPDHQTQQSLSYQFSLLPALLPMKFTPCQTHFSLWHLLKKGSYAKITCRPVAKGRKYVCRCCLLHFNSTDLNFKHLRPSAQEFFSPVSLCSFIRIEKKLVLSLSQIMKKPRL
jgi:hypothetical protein